MSLSCDESDTSVPPSLTTSSRSGVGDIAFLLDSTDSEYPKGCTDVEHSGDWLKPEKGSPRLEGSEDDKSLCGCWTLCFSVGLGVLMSILALLVWPFGSLLLPDRLDSAVLVSLRYSGSSESSKGISWSMLGEGSLGVAVWECRGESTTLSRREESSNITILSKSSSLESRPPFSSARPLQSSVTDCGLSISSLASTIKKSSRSVACTTFSLLLV